MMVPQLLMILGVAFVLVGFISGVCIFLRMIKDMSPSQRDSEGAFFKNFYRYAVAIAISGMGGLVAVIGLVWYLVTKLG